MPKPNDQFGHLQSNFDIRKNVHYHTLVAAGKDVAEAASTMCNGTQHVILTHLKTLSDAILSGNYDPTKYENTSIGPVIEQIRLCKATSAEIVPGGPKMKAGQRQGARPPLSIW